MAQEKQTPAKLEQAFKVSELNGWTTLIAAIRRIIAGERDMEKLNKGMGAQGNSQLQSILKELANIELY